MNRHVTHGRSDIVANRGQLGYEFEGLIAMYLMAWLGGGIAEELYFRGLLVTSLRNILGNTRLGNIITIVLATTIFALLHGYQGWIGMNNTAVYGGLSMTALYLWRKRLVPVIVAHGLYDMLAVTILFLAY